MHIHFVSTYNKQIHNENLKIVYIVTNNACKFRNISGIITARLKNADMSVR